MAGSTLPGAGTVSIANAGAPEHQHRDTDQADTKCRRLDDPGRARRVFREPARHAANIQELMEWYAAGKLKPRISATYPFTRVAEALGDLAARRVKGKVVLVP